MEIRIVKRDIRKRDNTEKDKDKDIASDKLSEELRERIIESEG